MTEHCPVGVIAPPPPSGVRAPSAPAVVLAEQRTNLPVTTTPAPDSGLAEVFQEPAAFSEGWGG